MERRKLGKTDLQVSVLGFGGSEIGYQAIPQVTVRKMLDAAFDLGVNVIDTAECYAYSEELIGHAVQGRRSDCYLFTKCGHPTGWGHGDWRPSSIIKSIERSLKRLRTDYVDLVQLHSCSETELRNGHVIDALKQARQRGYTRYIGYSGDGEAALYAIQSGEFDTLQSSINIAEQEPLDLTLSLASERQMGVIAKRPVANVAWSNGNRPPKDSYGYPYWERLQKLKYRFLQGELQDTVGLALRFTLSVPGTHTAIVGTTKPQRFQQNNEALEAGPLPNDLYQEIRSRWCKVAPADWAGLT